MSTSHHMKITQNSIKDLNVKYKTIKYSEDRTSIQLYDLGLEKQAQTNKENDQLNYIKIKNFCSLKEPLRKVTKTSYMLE